MRMGRKRAFWGVLFITPFMLGCAVFYFLPFLVSLYYSMTEGFSDKTFAGLTNYIELFQNQAFLLALKNTAVFMLIAIPLLIAAALLTGLLVHSLGKFGKIVQGILILPMIVPIASVIRVWQILFDNSGVLNHILSVLGIGEQHFFQGGWAMALVILIFVWKNFGYLSILYSVAILTIPGGCIEAAKLDGAGKWKVFGKIILPFLNPTTFFVLLLAVIDSFKIFREVFLLTGEYPDTSIYFIQHYMNNNFYNLDYQKLSSASTVLTLCIVIIVATVFRKEKRSAYME